MGWVVLGLFVFFICRKRSKYRSCRKHTSSGNHSRSRKSVSEIYRMQAETEDMNRRIRVMERALDPRDDRLRRDIQNL